MTYKEVVYIINDILKAVVSDDSYYETSHILFLADKFRGYIVKKYYDTVKKRLPQSYYQEICVDLEKFSNGDICDNNGTGQFAFYRHRDLCPEAEETDVVLVGQYRQGVGNIGCSGL